MMIWLRCLKVLTCGLLALVLAEPGLSEDLATIFTYQGRLLENGSPATDTYDFTFSLYDDVTGGSQVGSTLVAEDIPVEGGLFTVELDFGDVFVGQKLWLEIAVRPGESTGAYTPLSPRQELTAAPNALWARRADWNGIENMPSDFADGVDDNTTYAAGSGLELSGGAFSIQVSYRLPQGCSSNQVAKWDGSQWTCSADNDTTTFWSLSGNSGTDPSSNWLGTNDAVAFELRVGGRRAARLEPSADSNTPPNIVMGYRENVVLSGAKGAVVSGGGYRYDASTLYNNQVYDDYGTIGGGSGNIVGNNDGNTTTQNYATVGGGYDNTASGSYSTVPGGGSNTASGEGATVGGGSNNTASGDISTVAGGYYNTASADTTTIGGGYLNTASGYDSTIAGGYRNTASGYRSTIAGGAYNQVVGDYASVAGGGPYDPSNPTTTSNYVYDNYGFIGGGGGNIVGIDDGDTTTQTYSTIGGGYINLASGSLSTVGGGSFNTASGDTATVAGGYGNTASGYTATIPGGYNNEASGDHTLAAGHRAKANADGCFVWGDSTNADVTCSVMNRTVFRSSGGFYIYTNSSLSSGAYLAANSGSWTNMSDKNAKDEITPVDPEDVLEKLSQVPIYRWKYKAEPEWIRHMGPMAQDLYAAFGLGDDDRYITTIDTDGIALAAIKGLDSKLSGKVCKLEADNAQLSAKVKKLEAENQKLRERLDKLEALVLESKGAK